MIHEKTGLGNDFLGWVELPKNYNKKLDGIKESSRKNKKVRYRCTL